MRRHAVHPGNGRPPPQLTHYGSAALKLLDQARLMSAWRPASFACPPRRP